MKNRVSIPFLLWPKAQTHMPLPFSPTTKLCIASHKMKKNSRVFLPKSFQRLCVYFFWLCILPCQDFFFTTLSSDSNKHHAINFLPLFPFLYRPSTFYSLLSLLKQRLSVSTSPLTFSFLILTFFLIHSEAS